MVTLCPDLSCSVLLIGWFWPGLTVLCLDTEKTCFLLKRNQRHAAVCKGKAFLGPVGRAQHSFERLRTSLCQCGRGLVSSPWAQPKRAKPSQSMALALSHSFGAGEAKRSESPIQLGG